MQRMRIAGLCLGLLVLVACDSRPAAGDGGGDAALEEAVRRPLERAGAVEDLNLGRTTQLDETVEGDTE